MSNRDAPYWVHSDPHAADRATQAAGVPCSSGCIIRGRHSPGCPCATDHNDEHVDHCAGCQPRTADVGTWCSRCLTSTADALAEIPDLVVMVASRSDGMMNAHAAPTADPTRNVPGAPPSQSPAWDTADDYITWAWTWAETVADYLKQHGPIRFNRAGVPLPRKDLTAIITYLRAQLPRIAASELAVDFHTETLQSRRSLVYFSGTDRLMHRLKERCPSCNQKTLLREDGSDRVSCRNRDCGRVWLEAEYATLAHVAAS